MSDKDNNTQEPEPKRQRIQDASDPNKTPRAFRNKNRGFPQPASSSTSLPPSQSSHSEAASQTSGRSSPSKQLQLAGLEIDPNGFKRHALDLKNPELPPALRSMLLELQNCKGSGLGVVSNHWQQDIMERASQDAEFCVFLPHMFVPAGERDQLGPTPSPDEAMFLAQKTNQCDTTSQNEAGWNMMVHYPLLDRAIYGPQIQRRSQLVGFAPCTTAKIIREYHSVATQPKMIDFCTFLNPVPDIDPVASEAVEKVRGLLPLKVVNHTAFDPLRDCPIAISIETKAPDKAAASGAISLQLGTWHAAQWHFLEDLVALSGGSFDSLPYLPAIIVQGHQWSFAATTRTGKKNKLWLSYEFGDTSDVLGVYKTVWGVQRLCQWTEQVYWPWYRANALGLSEQPIVKENAQVG
ncbi:hypothetical protein F66182_6946 [Fusarium sp. NRRL 66182]|nr:hypothetical protein F66182_6946 [Fusarium sp. NRRL 66182]